MENRAAPGSGSGSLAARTVWVGDLGPYMCKDDEMFIACSAGDALGEGRGRVMREEFSNRVLHYGFIEFQNAEVARNAAEYAGKQALIIPPGGTPIPLTMSLEEADVRPFTTMVASGLTDCLSEPGTHSHMTVVSLDKVGPLEREYALKLRKTKEQAYYDMRELERMSAKQQDVLHARHTQEGLRELNKLDVAESLLQSADALEKFTDPNGSFMQRAASNRGTKSGGPTWA